MSDIDQTHETLAIVSGTCCLIFGALQVFYAILAFAYVMMTDFLDSTSAVVASLNAVKPYKPYVTPLALVLMKIIAAVGSVFAFFTIFAGVRCFPRKKVSHVDLVPCVVVCSILAILHFINSLFVGGVLYLFAVAFLSGILVANYRLEQSIPKTV